MIGLAQGWSLRVERGPDWLFVRASPPKPSPLDSSPLGETADPLLGHSPADVADESSLADSSLADSSLAETVWSVVERHFTYRLVLECDGLGRFTSEMISQLLVLNRRIRGQGGTLRLCGLSDYNQEMLRQCRVDGFFPRFSSRTQAVLGSRPLQPR